MNRDGLPDQPPSAATGRRDSTIRTPTGGVMTVEVGAVSGAVTVTTEDPRAGRWEAVGVRVSVAYEGSAEHYTVDGGPAPAGTTHEAIVQHLARDPGQDADGNPGSTSLADLG